MQFAYSIRRVVKYVCSFSDCEPRCRPRISNFESGADAAILSLHDGWTDCFKDFVSTTSIGRQRHGQVGFVVGTLVAVVNCILKPLSGTLSSLTWLCRGICTDIDPCSPDDRCIGDSMIQCNASGFSADVCQLILSKFDQVVRRDAS